MRLCLGLATAAATTITSSSFACYFACYSSSSSSCCCCRYPLRDVLVHAAASPRCRCSVSRLDLVRI
ncbi:hypothetical protein E2C01_031506 [Portunus trituberculatus]|uniref:Secreted peptide n=1 Tax=Portunus trituberculatus TaxID=210409 RepID=A0A5B7EYB3_PORTR|nr:hypothetical protein [Portunus trituberculatus]